jgi:hypothetical protein
MRILHLKWSVRELGKMTRAYWSWNNLKANWYYHERGSHLDEHGYWLKRHPSKVWVLSTFLSSQLSWYLAGVVCCFLDHKLEDNGSYAGPDSGYESLICTRCGREWYCTYY